MTPPIAPDPPPHWLGLRSLTDTLRQLVAIDSVNPDHGGPVGGERRVIEWAGAFVERLGLEPEIVDAAPGRPNLRVKLDGEQPGPPLLLTTHIDTVSVKGMDVDPFGAEVRGGRLYGRGATDAKAQAAAMLHAMAAWADSGRRPPRSIELALVVGEETDFIGSKALLANGVHAAGIVVGEPTNLRVVTTHKGCVRWWIRFEGRSAHSAKPHLGVNAIGAAAELIHEIDRRYADLLRERSDAMLGPATINVARIEGGDQANLVPDRCRILLDRRTLPGETEQGVLDEMNSLFDAARKQFDMFHAIQEPPYLVAAPVRTDPDHPLVRQVQSVAADLGRPADPIGVDYATDASILAATGLPIVVVGPGSIDQAHRSDEFVQLDEVVAGAQFYFDLMGRDWRGEGML